MQTGGPHPRAASTGRFPALPPPGFRRRGMQNADAQVTLEISDQKSVVHGKQAMSRKGQRLPQVETGCETPDTRTLPDTAIFTSPSQAVSAVALPQAFLGP